MFGLEDEMPCLSSLGLKRVESARAKRLPQQEIPQTSSTIEGDVRVSPLWDPSPVSFESRRGALPSNQQTLLGGCHVQSIRLRAETKRIKTPPPMVQSLAS